MLSNKDMTEFACQLQTALICLIRRTKEQKVSFTAEEMIDTMGYDLKPQTKDGNLVLGLTQSS
jgi:hypothetical protein